MSKVILVAGLGYGDEGKGSIVDHLCHKEKATLVVRYNGGAQAAHNVVLEDGRHHTFSQFGSGTFAGARTHLSRFMMVNPISMESEERHLRTMGVTDACARMTVERETLVTTPFHVAINRMRELARGDGHHHGSCGMGIGETMADSLNHPHDVLRVGDLEHEPTVRSKLARLQDKMATEAAKVAETVNTPRPEGFYHEWDLITRHTLIDDCLPYFDRFRRAVRFVDNDYLAGELDKSTTIFEGAQGVLLDQDFGFQPYTTWTDCTFGNAARLIAGFTGDVRRMGVLRTYMTRHGAGPLVTEDGALRYPEAHNGNGVWQKAFRFGHFDAVMLKYAFDVIGGIDEIALTHLDHHVTSLLDRTPQVCVGYKHKKTGAELQQILPQRPFDLQAQERLTEKLLDMNPIYENLSTSLLRFIEQQGHPITICSFGPTSEDKRAAHR